jgi:hypothetical protein
VSTLRSVLEELLEELQAEDLAISSDVELGEDMVELERASRVLEAERSRRLVEVDRRGAWAVDGHLSVVFVAHRQIQGGVSRASQQVKLVRALRSMPVTSRAMGEGELSSEAVGMLIGTRDAAPEAFSEAEPLLLDAAGVLPARQFRAVIAYWPQVADASAAEERARYVYEGVTCTSPHDRGDGRHRRRSGPGVGTESHDRAPCCPGRVGAGRDGRPERSPAPGPMR